MNGKLLLRRLPRWAKPTEDLTPRQRKILILVGLASMSAAFINTLFTQTVAFAADEFDISQSGQGIGASVVRFGIVICLPLVALADRYGRRPVMIAMAWAAPLVSALGAIAPSYVFLVGTQAIGRPLGLTLDILIAVVALEDFDNVIETGKQRVLLVVIKHPLGQDPATAANDAGKATLH